MLNKRKLLLWFQIKKAYKSLPKMFLSAILFGGLLIFMGLFQAEYMSKQNADTRYNIAVVLPENSDQYTKLAFKFLGEIDTVKNMCTFIQMDQQSAFDGMEMGTIFSIILVPDEFMNHILNGTNTPAQIILPESGLNSQSALFRELIQAGAGDLSAAQAGIYALSDICGNFLIQNAVPDAEDYLNKAYFSYALDRNVYYDVEEVSAYHGLNSIQFYLCSGLVALYLLCGIFCIDLLKKDSSGFYNVLIRENIHPVEYAVYRILGITLVYYSVSLLVWIMAKLAGIRFDIMNEFIPAFSLNSAVGLFMLIFSIFSFVYFIYQIAVSQSAGVLLLFVTTALMLFASGALIPSVFLPEIVKNIGKVLPSAQYLSLCRQIIMNYVKPLTVLANIVWTFGFIITADMLHVKMVIGRNSE